MARLRVALFGSSSHFSERALRELAAAHDVVAAVLPPRTGLGGLLRRLARRDSAGPLEAGARELGVPLIDLAPGEDAVVAERLRALRPDLICIALHPRRVSAQLLGLAPLGALNAHPSLLPRHRGPLPLFWTYHANDRNAGVTVHHAADRLDAGDIVAQESFELPRGYPVSVLDHDVARRAARLLRQAADARARGNATRHPQDESLATYAPRVKRGATMVPFDEWDVERVWHFLAGLCPPYREPLVDERGSAVAYDRVVGFRVARAESEPGRVRRAGDGLLLQCRDGIVELA